MSVPEETVRPAAFLLDLYGTLVDIHTDENQPSLWKRMAGFVLSRGADWEGKALRRAYLEGLRQEEERLRLRDRGLPWAQGEIDLALVFARLYTEKGVRADAALIADGPGFPQGLHHPPAPLRRGKGAAGRPGAAGTGDPPFQRPESFYPAGAGNAGTHRLL